MTRFPEGFLFGAATSSYQVEGDNDLCDWADWERRPGVIVGGGRSGEAAGWWRGKAEEDLRRAAAMGQNAHRMSVEWARLEPAPGRYDNAAFERYRAMLGEARRLGLATMVTLHHFTLPRWAAAAGGFRSREMPATFARFAAECVRRLGDLVDLFATINEPNVLAYSSYADVRWPPGAGKLDAAFEALGTMLEGHAAAFAAIKRTRPDARVGVVLNAPRFDPAREGHPADRFAAFMQDFVFTGGILEALDSGRFAPPLSWRRRRVEGLARSFDFLGLNYYGRFAVRFSLAGPQPFGRHVQTPTTRTEHVDWGQAYPLGLTQQLARFASLGVPVYVTENGLYDNDDRLRPRFLVDHVRAVGDAIAAGHDVRGYFFWSLVDNFEWAEGWTTRFGLLGWDPVTGERHVRRSARVYEAICRARGIPDEVETLLDDRQISDSATRAIPK